MNRTSSCCMLECMQPCTASRPWFGLYRRFIATIIILVHSPAAGRDSSRGMQANASQHRATRDRRIRVTASYSRQILYNCIWTGHWNEAVTRMQLNIFEFPYRNGSGLKWPLLGPSLSGAQAIRDRTVAGAPIGAPCARLRFVPYFHNECMHHCIPCVSYTLHGVRSPRMNFPSLYIH